MRKRVTPLCLALASFLHVGTASATKMAAVVRGAGAGADKAAGFVSHALQQLLADDGRYEMIEVAGQLDSDAERAKRAFAEAEKLVDKAQGAYETLEFDPAVDFLKSAVTKYQKHAAYVEDPKKVADALMLLAAVRILRGEQKAGAERIAEAVAILPSVEPDPRIFNPSMRQVFQKVADSVQSKGKGKASVTSSPSYAEIFIDGVFRGVTPMEVDGLTDGEHYLRLVRQGYKANGTVLKVNAGRDASFNGSLEPAAKYDEFDKVASEAVEAMVDAGEDIGGSLPGPVAALGSMLATDHLFLAEVRLDGERVKVVAAQYDIQGGQRLKTTSHVFTYDTAGEAYAREMSDMLRTQFGATTLAKKTSQHGEEVVGEPLSGNCFGMPCPKFKKMALVVGVAGGAVLGGVGGLLDFLAWQDNQQFGEVPQISGESASLSSAGKTKALLGDILVPLGVALAATGVGMYLFYQPSAASTTVVSVGAPQVHATVLPLDGGAALWADIQF